MAFFSDLVRAVAQAEGMDEMTVTGIGQYLRDEGMITKGGRGRSAARMSSQDAANLLIAVNGTSLAKDAPKAVRAFRETQTEPLALEYTSNPFAELSTGTRTFGSALERLIEWCSPDPMGRSKLQLILSEQPKRTIKGADRKTAQNRKLAIPSSEIEIVFRRPVYSASLQILNPHLSYSKDAIVFYESFKMNFDSVSGEFPEINSDRRDLTIISSTTLTSVSQAIFA